MHDGQTMKIEPAVTLEELQRSTAQVVESFDKETSCALHKLTFVEVWQVQSIDERKPYKVPVSVCHELYRDYSKHVEENVLVRGSQKFTFGTCETLFYQEN
ncbi:hypothetical protein AMECASPLE_013499 [Ameca splendens]|uniref:Uncharacterized protein n=1 Tax=Ameca splendens TaxID=208324 RepID=A0ABV0YCA1_9TELE